jgi:nucleoside-diphosphate-sugar epimerase
MKILITSAEKLRATGWIPHYNLNEVSERTLEFFKETLTRKRTFQLKP